MEIKLKKQQLNCIFDGLDYDQFAQIETSEKVIEIEGARELSEDALPSEPKTLKNWKIKRETIKIREMDKIHSTFTRG